MTEYAGKVAIRRMMDAVRDGGVDVGAVEVSPDGTIRIFDVRALPKAPVDDFDKWANKL